MKKKESAKRMRNAAMEEMADVDMMDEEDNFRAMEEMAMPMQRQQ